MSITSQLQEKVAKLQAVPNMQGVYVIEQDGKVLDCSTPSREALGDPQSWRFLFQAATTAVKQMDEFDTSYLMKFISNNFEYSVVPEKEFLIVAVKNI